MNLNASRRMVCALRLIIAILLVGTLGNEFLNAQSASVFPLKISPDNRHLVDQNGLPFLINGDAGWSLMVGLTDEEVGAYLEDRRARGFNAILVNLIEHYFNGPANANGEQPFTTPGDFSTPNEDYFAHVDSVVQVALEKNILLLLTPAYLGFNCGEQGWCSELRSNGVEKCRDYGRYVGNRYKDFPNIIWVHGGDAEAGNAIAELEAIVQGIAEVDTVHLNTAHCSRYNSALDCYDYAWLDVNNTYSDCEYTSGQIFDDYNRDRMMPVFFIEGRYENENNTGSTCLRSQAYWSILGGAVGHVLGNYPIWPFDNGWQQELNSTGSRSMSFMAALFLSRAWNELVPDYNHQVVVGGYGELATTDYVSAARTSDSSTAIIYLPVAKEITVDLNRISGSSVTGWWYNPSNGLPTLIDAFEKISAAPFSPPGSGDWVLVLDNGDLQLPAPGSYNYPLSVSLAGFSARAIGNSVQLSWKTATETDNYGFEIERRSNGSDFERIGFVEGHNSTSSTTVYAFVDRDLSAGEYEYRLKQLDINGDADFTAAVLVEVSLPAVFDLYQNHPNPFNPNTTITYSLPHRGSVELVVFNLRGEVVDTLVDSLQEAGYHSVRFDAGAFPSGVYFYRLMSSDFLKIRKMVLLR